MLIQNPQIEEFVPLPGEVVPESRSPWIIRLVARNNHLLPVVTFIHWNPIPPEPPAQLLGPPEDLTSQPNSFKTRQILSETQMVEELFRSGNDFTPSFPGSAEPRVGKVLQRNLREDGTTEEPVGRELISPIPSTSTQVEYQIAFHLLTLKFQRY